MSNLIGTITTNTQVITGVVQEVGRQGYSAYELALLDGFVGTLQEWLESLKGRDGIAAVVQETGTDTTLAMSQDAITRELGLKVDKEIGKSLVDDLEITKLLTVAENATANRSDSVTDLLLSDKVDKVLDHSLVSDAEILRLSTVDNFDNSGNVVALLTKVDKEAGKSLIADSEITRLSTVTNFDNTANETALAGKVDKVLGKQLSDENYTLSEKNKLAGLESSRWKGLFTSYAQLPSTGSSGDYADVDAGSGSDVQRYIWDGSDSKWIAQSGIVTALTGAEIKQLYEAQPDTNAFSDAEKGKLAGIAAEATKNRSDAASDALLANKVDKVSGKGLSTNDFTTTEKNKLTGIAVEATKNRSDAATDTLLAGKIDKTAIKQATGTSATDVMSQKAVTDLVGDINAVLDAINGEIV